MKNILSHFVKFKLQITYRKIMLAAFAEERTSALYALSDGKKWRAVQAAACYLL
jgi:hypothetical protein